MGTNLIVKAEEYEILIKKKNNVRKKYKNRNINLANGNYQRHQSEITNKSSQNLMNERKMSENNQLGQAVKRDWAKIKIYERNVLTSSNCRQVWFD